MRGKGFFFFQGFLVLPPPLPLCGAGLLAAADCAREAKLPFAMPPPPDLAPEL